MAKTYLDLCFLLGVLIALTVQRSAAADFEVARDGQSMAAIVRPDAPAAEETSAAKELAHYLSRVTGGPFTPVAESAAPAGAQIHVGATRAALEAVGPLEKTGLDADGLIIKVGNGRRAVPPDRLFLLGRNPWGTEFAVYRFLYRFAGVRWYLPTELGEHVPSQPSLTVPAVNPQENPDWLSRQWSAADTVDRGVWNKRNLIRPRFSFHHYLLVWLPPELYDQHPDWFPLRSDGKRYRPSSTDDHSWQPCFASQGMADYVADRILETFAKNPQTLSASIGVNDSSWAGYCQCEACKALDVPGQTSLHGGPDYSNRFFTFANRVAEKVAAQYPDHTIGCLAYNACENPPTFPVHPMVVPYLTNDRAQWRDPKFAQADREWIAAWRKVCPSVATYTYEYGSGYVIPRVYFHLQKKYMQYCRDQGVKGWYAEIYCNWALDGPKAWLGSQLLWDTDQDVDRLLEDFHRNFFGPAQAPMRAYFEFCERQWMRQKGPGVWFRYFFDPRQLELFPPEVCREARRWLTEAQRLATAEPYRARVRLISQAFRMTELYSAVVHAGTGLPSGTMAAKAADQTIAAVLAGMEANRRREQHLRFVIDRDPLLKPVIPFDGRANFSPQAASPGTLWQLLVWCAQHGRKDLAGKLIDGLGQGDPSGEMATIAQVMQTLIGQKGKEVTEGERGEGQRNLIQNGTFDALEGPPGDATGVDWKTQGSPPGWSYWERNPGSGRLEWKHSAEGGYVTLTGTKGACFIQTVPVTPGTLYLLVADYRGRVPAGTKASLVVSWKDEKGGWLDEARRVTDLPEGAHRDWTTTCTAGRAPEGAATAIVMLFADEQGAADEVAFDNVRMFAVEGRPQGHGDTEG